MGVGILCLGLYLATCQRRELNAIREWRSVTRSAWEAGWQQQPELEAVTFFVCTNGTLMITHPKLSPCAKEAMQEFLGKHPPPCRVSIDESYEVTPP